MEVVLQNGTVVKQRVAFADIARGLAVIYFMWCHTVNIHVAWVDTWAMPVFFVVMGMFFKPMTTWKEMIVKKINTILVPFFLLSIPSYIQYIVTLSSEEFALKVLDPFACVHGVGWFLVCIFFCYIIYYAIIRITKNNVWWSLVICVVLSILSFYASLQRIMGYRIVLPMFLSTSFTVLPFIFIGDKLRDMIKKERTIATNGLLGFMLTASAVGGAFLLHFKGGEYIVNWFYGQSWLKVFILSIIGTASILFICKLLPGFISYVGEHSLLLLMIHPYIIRILRLFDLPRINIFILTLVLALILIGILARYIPILEGKKKIFT